MSKFKCALCNRNRLVRLSNIKSAFHRGAVTAVVAATLVCAASVEAAPSVLWRTNVNATLFAVDSETNVYANANGTVITLNSQGVPFQTNHLCPVPSIAPGFALRDFSGNFYFAGNFDGTNDFGGKVIVGGWTSNTPSVNKWQPGFPTCYLAKYSPSGALLWATRIDGLIAADNAVSDLVLNPDNSVTVGIFAGWNWSQIAQFTSTGTNLWQSASLDSPSFCGPVKLTGLHGTNGGLLLYSLSWGSLVRGHYTSSGTITFEPTQAARFFPTTTPSGKPVTTSANEIFSAGMTDDLGTGILQKAIIGGGVVWTQAVASVETWLLNGDNKGNLYLSGADGSFTEYNSAGASIWTNNYGSPATFALSDLAGNRLVQFADNSIALISADPGAVAPHLHFNGQAGDGMASTGFQFSLSGNSGSTFQVLWSTNYTSWQSMGYVTNSTGDVEVVDPDATNHLQKFYRIVP